MTENKPIINIIFDDLNQRIKNIGEKCLNFQEENKNLKEQLTRKTQECEELKKERNEYFELVAIRTEVLAKIANKLGINTAIIENKEIFNKIDQLKISKEQAEQKLNRMREYCKYITAFNNANKTNKGLDVEEVIQIIDEV